MLNGP